MAYTPPAPLWQLVSTLERQQLSHWRHEFYRSEDLETVVTEHLLKIETTVTRLRGGNISVTFALLDKKDSNSVAGYFRLRKVLNGHCEVVSGTLSDA